MNKPDILIIDDETAIRRMLEITLQSNDYSVKEAGTAKEGLITAAKTPPDLVLLDIGLPDDSGHNVLKKLREWYSKPIIILSVQSSEEDIVNALDYGANDYLVKPFRTGELLARIRTALRASSNETSEPVFHFNGLEVDLSLRTVRKNGELLKLTSTEYSLLALFIKNEGRVLTHHFLLKEIWGSSFINESQYLRVYMAQLRKKIETNANRPEYLITEAGVGYRFSARE